MVKKLLSQISEKTIKGVYVLFGDEEYLKNVYCKRIMNSLAIEKGDMNYSYFRGENTTQEQALSMLNVLPFFNDKRLIVFENTALLKMCDNETIGKFANIPSDVVVVFIEKSIDKRTKNYKLLKQYALFVEFSILGHPELVVFAGGIIKKHNKMISDEALNYLVSNSYDNMYSIENSVNKLLAYCAEADKIDLAAVKITLPVLIENEIFEFIRLIATKNPSKAIEKYKKLVYLGESDFKLMKMLQVEFSRLLQMKEIENNPNEYKNIKGIRPFLLNKYVEMSKKMKKTELLDNYIACCKLEEDIKTGRRIEKTGFEFLLVSLCR